ncbi:MAG TPA: dephospho-CoA kinase [Actinomycetota bacterium]|nr:dephospho-CoA kinase [Actinomycetota bacterium]
MLVGLTGGIASGKSTVSRMLAERGAVIIDADEIAHSILEPGGAAYDDAILRFGREIVGSDGRIDRAKLGAIVFSDADARHDLEAITHPRIFSEILRRVAQGRDEASVVVVDAALLVETLPDRGKALGLDALIVVSARPRDQVERLISDRQMTRTQAQERIAAQLPVEKRLAAADIVLDNRGSLADLETSVGLLWDELTGDSA